jgi:hypothetical protein
MPRLLLVGVVWFVSPLSAFAQIGSGATLPENCNTGGGSLFYLTTPPVGLYICVDGSWIITPSGDAAWGAITGTLADQTDLQSALDGKQAAGSYLATNGNGGSLTGLTKAQVGLANVDNTSDANKPVSSATQTALNGKQATLVSATNIKTVNGSTLLGSGDLVVGGGSGLGYTLSVQALTSAPADGATIYFGQLPKAPVTVAGNSRVYIRKAGTVKAANIFSFSGTIGTADAWPCSIRLNNTTDTLIESVAANTAERTWDNVSLNISVVVGDYVEIKCVNPTWATNPNTTIFGGYLYVE